MRHLVVRFILVALVVVAACGKTKPTMTGRLSGPTALAEFKGCSQNVDPCVGSEHHLLLIANSLSNDLRIFDVDASNFFVAPEALFPLTIPVGESPVSLAIDPLGQYAFVVNAVSQNVSLVDLAMNQLVEVDTDANTTTHAAELDPQSDRALAGVSRVGFALYGDVQPEYIVAPPQDINWDKTKPLKIYVSLLATGQIAVLSFQYPDKDAGTPQRLDLLELVTVGGMPSGLALTKDGSKLFVADEDLDTIYMIDTTISPMTFVAIGVGGSSRRLALTPDESALYVIHSQTPDISVVDVATGTRYAQWYTICNSTTLGDTIHFGGMPRSVVFVEDDTNALQVTIDAASKSFKTLAYVSNLNGDVYLVDAVNHCVIDTNTTNTDDYGNVIIDYAVFVPSVLTGMDDDLISVDFSSTSTDTDRYRIFLLSEGSNAIMEFFPLSLSSTNYLLYQ
jgi:hypothetical protein